MNFWTFLDRNAFAIPLALIFICGAILGSCVAAAHAYEATHSCAPTTGGR